MTHPSTEISSSHDKNWGVDQSHHFNQVVLLHHEAHPDDSVLQRNSRQQNPSLYCSLIARLWTISPPAPVVIWGCPTWTLAKHLQLGVGVSMAPCSSRSVISSAPPAAIVHPVGPLCVTLLLHPDMLQQSMWHWAHCYRSVATEPYMTSRHLQRLKITINLQDQCFSTHSDVKHVRSKQNIWVSNFSLQSNKWQMCTDGHKDMKILVLFCP